MPEKYTLQDLLEIMARLRAPDGCPWDREQTHRSILSHLIEEAYEFVDAAESDDTQDMCEELGDLLLQVVFQAQMAKEANRFDFEDVVHAISEKLVHRHPHVFGDSSVHTPDQVQAQWDTLKEKEKENKGKPLDSGLLSGLPKHLSPLIKAHKIGKKCEKVNFDWEDYRGPLQKVKEELGELEREAGGGSHERLEEELGDLLFSVVSLGRKLGVDSERALARGNLKFMKRFAAMEALMAAEGRKPGEADLVEMDGYWEQVKKREAKPSRG